MKNIKNRSKRKKEHEDMKELRKMHRHLSINDNSMYVDQWCPIAKIAMTMWLIFQLQFNIMHETGFPKRLIQ